jgi:DnaJ-class molecular chaperone
VTITESQARTGARVEVTFNGRMFKVSIPADTKNGAMLRLRDATDAGDLYVKIIVVPDPSPSEPEPDPKPRPGGDDGDDKHTKPSKDY